MLTVIMAIIVIAVLMVTLLGGSGGLSKWVNKGDKWSYYTD